MKKFLQILAGTYFGAESVLAENYDYFFNFQQSALRGWLIGIVKN